jgi:hypothetical protein
MPRVSQCASRMAEFEFIVIDGDSGHCPRDCMARSRSLYSVAPYTASLQAVMGSMRHVRPASGRDPVHAVRTIPKTEPRSEPTCINIIMPFRRPHHHQGKCDLQDSKPLYHEKRRGPQRCLKEFCGWPTYCLGCGISAHRHCFESLTDFTNLIIYFRQS